MEMKLCGSLQVSLTFDFIVKGAESHLGSETSRRSRDETNADMNQSQSKSDEKPEPGDLIEIFRGLYQHWAVYIGDGLVVHLAPPSEVAGAGAKSVMSVAAQRAVVKKEKLSDVVGTDKWKVNKDLDEKYVPHPTDTIVKEALELVGTEQPCNIITWNCEHFATELRYGKAESRQVRRAAV